jgi:hypothetical protein
MSEHEKDISAGLNGGFEVSRNGLPVNWLMYTPETVPDSEFAIILDNENFKEGTQSLRFDVSECSSKGGWHSPGFTNEFFDIGKIEGEGTYMLSFWIRNDKTTFEITGGSVAPNKGDMKTLLNSSEQIDEWKQYTFEINVPKERWLRFQLNILQPGTFWIDDVRINEV